jgi:ComF family protein
MQGWLKTGLDLVYPRACAGCRCGLSSEDSHLCWECKSDIQMIAHPYCSLCGDPLQGRIDHSYTCYQCHAQRPHFDLARSAVRFRGVMSRLVHHFKYSEAFWLEDDLAELMFACCQMHEGFASVDFLTGVPLFRVRSRERGYNQADLLADALAKRLGRPSVPNVARRTRDTQTQTHLTAKERASNVHLAFSVTRPPVVYGRRVLLVDDVMTTGATVNECARALKEAGAAKVLVLTLARGG